jgi:hypothetical protein
MVRAIAFDVHYLSRGAILMATKRNFAIASCSLAASKQRLQFRPSAPLPLSPSRGSLRDRDRGAPDFRLRTQPATARCS